MLWRICDSEDGHAGYGEATAFMSISTSVCQIWVTHEAFRCSLGCFQSGVQVWFESHLEVNSISQHTKRNGFLLCQKKGTNSEFWVPTWACVPRIRPNKSACSSWAGSSHSRLCQRGNSLQDVCHLHVSISAVCCAIFAVIRMANHAGSYCYWGEGTANINAEIKRWCVLNAALQKVSSY